MLNVERDALFLRKVHKIRDNAKKEKVKKLIKKILENPGVGKPMRYSRKGTREVYLAPLRLSYAYIEKENKVIFLDVYHKDEQ
ncbi:MAG: type II toxin-antitoxin system RelE/ParE family toxin [Nanoarchaeota archaeon]|nr:type II toxin-antitoxin system RelE/ParE family toxin [Nanoarchaeota archaeon]